MEKFPHLKQLNEYKKFLLQLALDCIDRTNEQILFNQYISAIINRAIQLNRGYQTLIQEDNYLCAIPLLRMQIDNCFRFYALNLAEDKDQFILDWMNGKKISDHKICGTKIKMTDKSLRDEVAKIFPNLGGMYDQSCNFVHLSQENLYNTSKVIKGTRTIQMHITGYDTIKSEVKKNIDHCMLYATNVLSDMIRAYPNKIVLAE